MKQSEFFPAADSPDKKNLPLSYRLSPKTLDEFSGQQEIVGKDKLLRRMIESGRVSSLIFYGQPGTGKSALAKIIAKKTKSLFLETNAVTIGVGEIRKITETAKFSLLNKSEKTILLLDEIHHFNKSQQDALLPHVENGTISLIGTTTENPFFYVNKALISRSILFEFKPLAKDDLYGIMDRALKDKETGLGNYKIEMTDDAKEHLVNCVNGDARRLLNAVEIGVLSTHPDSKGIINFNIDVARESIQKRVIRYDKSSDEHYDHISAFIKSMRGSDPDASIYWMVKMLQAGEDPRFIARRIIICASEDVGNADPRALTLAISALKAIEFVGLPEGEIPLAQAAIYVASAPKSNASYMALNKAKNEVKSKNLRQVPAHLRDSILDSKGKRGHGAGYIYPHDCPGHYVKQEYMSDKVVFYEPTDQGYEIRIRERLNSLKK